MKAKIIYPDGTVVELEGPAEEVERNLPKRVEPITVPWIPGIPFVPNPVPQLDPPQPMYPWPMPDITNPPVRWVITSTADPEPLDGNQVTTANMYSIGYGG